MIRISVEKKRKKRKLYKIGIPLTLSAILILRCTHYSESQTEEILNNINNNSSITTTYVDDYIDTTIETENQYQENQDNILENIYEIYNPNTGISDMDLSEFNISFSENSYNYFEKYIKSIKVKYPYEELFGINEALKKYEEVNFEVQSKKNTFSDIEEINPNQLLEVVLENNKKYLEENTINLYNEIKKKKLFEICEIICTVFNDYSKNGVINTEKVKSFLYNLKIFNDSSLNNAYISESCLVINSNLIGVLGDLNYNDTDRSAIKQKVVQHEIMHIFQACSPEFKEKNTYKYNYGMCYYWEDLEINPLMFKWFLEASAEKNTMTYNNSDKPLVYEYSIGYLESMSIATILKNNVKVNQTEKLCFSNKLEKLFDQFGCDSLESNYEILKMMYSLNIMQQEPEDFFEVYNKNYKKELNEEEFKDLKKTFKGSICLTLTKQFYLNLSKQLELRKINIQDVFFLITVFENDINNHIEYNHSANFKYNEEFLNKYIQIQNEFFELISKNVDYNYEKLLHIYNAYSIKSSRGYNYNLNWLGEDKKNYILKRHELLKHISTGSIRNSYDLMEDFIQKKVKLK